MWFGNASAGDLGWESLGEIRGPKYEEVDECDLSAVKSRRGVVLAGVLRMQTLKWFGDDEYLGVSVVGWRRMWFVSLV